MQYINTDIGATFYCWPTLHILPPYWRNIAVIGQRKPQTPNVGAINVIRYWRNIFLPILVQHWKCWPTLHILTLYWRNVAFIGQFAPIYSILDQYNANIACYTGRYCKARFCNRMSVHVCVRPSVTFVDQDHIGCKSWKLIAWTITPTHSLFVAQRPSTYFQGNMRKV